MAKKNSLILLKSKIMNTFILKNKKIVQLNRKFDRFLYNVSKSAIQIQNTDSVRLQVCVRNLVRNHF